MIAGTEEDSYLIAAHYPIPEDMKNTLQLPRVILRSLSSWKRNLMSGNS